MSRVCRSLLTVTAFAVLFFRARAMAEGQLGDEAQIRALESRFAEAFKSKDVDRIMTSYEHSPKLAFFDVVLRNEHLGWDAYRNDWRSFFDAMGAIDVFEIKDLTVHVDGNVAYGYSFQHYLAKTKAGEPRDVTVRVTDVYQKIASKWLIVQEHVSVPVDPQTGKGDFRSGP